jgi:hypothetical protein
MSDKIIINKLNLLYSKAGYMSKYGTDVWTAAIICLAFIIFINYYYFVNVVEVIKTDWPNQRCNPLVMPFAGFIKKPTDMTNLEFTASNFNNCFNTILQDVVLIALQPIYFAINIIQEAVNNLIKAFDELRKLTKGIRDQFSSIITQIYTAMNNLVVTMIGYIVKIKDSMLKINGILTTSIYTLFGSYMAMTSLFLCIIDFIILILISIAITVLAFFILQNIPIIGFIFTPLWIISAITMLLILIPALLFEFMLLRVMDLSTPPAPGIPGCFAGGTTVELFSGETKNMKDIEVDDILKNGSTVTAVIQFAAEEQHLYRLRGTLVTGEHRVFHPEMKWIKAKNHPESIYIANFNEPFVYCLNTTSKTFTIGDTLFSDWDDIDENVWEDLHNNCASLPKDFTLADIHPHLDSGFQANSTIVLKNGSIVTLADVKVNDLLETGEKIVGVVKIAAHDLKLFNYTFICGSANIHVDDKNLGIINGMQYSAAIEIKHTEPFLYHFLTDTKFVTINNIRFNDYNSGIDKYLR